MKRLVPFLVVSMLFAGVAFGQSDGRGRSVKSATISGKISQDGKNVIGKNGKTWVVANPATLAGYKGQDVKVKCQRSPGSQDIRVLSVKMVPQTRYAVNLGDSAFRR